MNCTLLSVIKITQGSGGSECCESLECGRVSDGYLFPPQLDPALFGKAFEQTADDLPRAAQFVGQCLMGGVDRAGLVDQEIGETLVELLKGHRRNQLHQVGEPVGKQMEHVAAKRFMTAKQCVEGSSGQYHNLQSMFGDAARVIARVSEQAAAG